MRKELRIDDITYLNQFMSGTDLKILTDLMLSGERMETGNTVIFRASAEEISHRTGLCVATVYKSIKRMLEVNYLSVANTWRKGKDGEARSYVVNV